jgi:hypothetical protein
MKLRFATILSLRTCEVSRGQFMRRFDLLIGVLFFFISLITKLPYLGTFLTIDEPRWIRGAGQFLLSLSSGDLAKTYWHFHPGITVTWGEAIILWLQKPLNTDVTLEEFVRFQMDHLSLLVGAMRLSTVLLTSLTLPFMYLFARPLIGLWPAVLGVGLVAVDPFWVAHSRIVNGDALAGALMVTSFLAFSLLLVKPSYKLALVSGIFVGLAFLTKLPSQILVPVILMVAAIGYFSDRNWKFWLKALLLCGLSSAIVFFALWPAMWVAPINTLETMFVDTFQRGAIAGREKPEFFIGEVREAQSQFFYPLALLFRLTPINMIGSALTLGLLITTKDSRLKRATLLLWLFVAAVVVFANFSPKKADRYIMSAILAVDLLAGIGWVWLIQKVTVLSSSRIRLSAATVTLIVVQLFFVVVNYPYILTYYNPLLGGYAKAAESIPVGRGEGLEQAAAWINSQPDGQFATVSPYYENVTNHYLLGTSLDWSKDGKTQVLADYVVFYITQIQRQLPRSGIVDYFQDQNPAHVVSHGDTPYIWVYRRERPLKKLAGEAAIVGRAQIVGYHQAEPKLNAGGSTDIVLYFLTHDQNLPKNEDFSVSLEDAAGNRYGQWQSAAFNQWLPSAIVEWTGQLSLPADLAPGDYRLRVSLVDTNINSEVTFFPFKDEIITIEEPNQ